MSKVPPILLSAIICDRVIFDKFSGVPSLINIVQNINAPRYPVRYWRLVFFCELTNGHGDTKMNIRIVDAEEEEKVVFEKDEVIKFTDVKQVLTLAVDLRGIVFSRPGEYRFQMFADGCLLGERRIICRKTKLPAAGGSSQQNN